MMAFILGNSIHIADSSLSPNVENRSQINFSIEDIYMKLGGWNPKSFTDEIKEPKSQKSVLRGALSLYGSGQDTTAKELVSLLEDQNVFLETLCELVADHFGWTDYQIPD